MTLGFWLPRASNYRTIPEQNNHLPGGKPVQRLVDQRGRAREQRRIRRPGVLRGADEGLLPADDVILLVPVPAHRD